MDWKTNIKNIDLMLHWRIALCIMTGGLLGFFLLPYFIPKIETFTVSWTGSVFGALAGLIIGYGWQLKDRSRRNQTSGILLILASLGWSFFAVFGIIGINSDKEEYSNKIKLIDELHQKLSKSPNEIEILPYQLSKKEFKYIITDSQDLNKFIREIKVADTQAISGHSGPVFECTIVLKTKFGDLTYLASVHKYERKDLFISNVFYRKTGNNSYSRGRGNEVRIPNLGEWIMKIAPKGKL